MTILTKEAIVGVTCWKLNPMYSRLWCFQPPHMAHEIWGGDLKNSHWKLFEKGMKNIIHMMSYVKGCSSTTQHIMLVEFRNLTCPLASYMYSTMACPPTFLLVSQPSNLTFLVHLAKHGFDTWHKLTTMWKASWFPIVKSWQLDPIQNHISWSHGGFFLLKCEHFPSLREETRLQSLDLQMWIVPLQLWCNFIIDTTTMQNHSFLPHHKT